MRICFSVAIVSSPIKVNWFGVRPALTHPQAGAQHPAEVTRTREYSLKPFFTQGSRAASPCFCRIFYFISTTVAINSGQKLKPKQENRR
jgi:hypothetical protein